MTTDPKKLSPVSYRIEETTYAELAAMAKKANRKRNELARLIFEWAFPIYKAVGSYDGLQRITIDFTNNTVITTALPADVPPLAKDEYKLLRADVEAEVASDLLPNIASQAEERIKELGGSPGAESSPRPAGKRKAK